MKKKSLTSLKINMFKIIVDEHNFFSIYRIRIGIVSEKWRSVLSDATGMLSMTLTKQLKYVTECYFHHDIGSSTIFYIETCCKYSALIAFSMSVSKVMSLPICFSIKLNRILLAALNLANFLLFSFNFRFRDGGNTHHTESISLLAMTPCP